MITASASDPGKYRHGHATVRATREGGCLVLTWIGGGHSEPTEAQLDALIATTRASGDETLYAVEEVREAFKGAHAGDLIACAKQEERIVARLIAHGHAPMRVPAVDWRRALTGEQGPSDDAIAVVVCGLVRGARQAPLGRQEREHAYDAAGLAVYAISVRLGLLGPTGQLALPPHVAAELAMQMLRDKDARKRKRAAKKKLAVGTANEKPRANGCARGARKKGAR